MCARGKSGKRSTTCQKCVSHGYLTICALCHATNSVHLSRSSQHGIARHPQDDLQPHQHSHVRPFIREAARDAHARNHLLPRHGALPAAPHRHRHGTVGARHGSTAEFVHDERREPVPGEGQPRRPLDRRVEVVQRDVESSQYHEEQVDGRGEHQSDGEAGDRHRQEQSRALGRRHGEVEYGQEREEGRSGRPQVRHPVRRASVQCGEEDRVSHVARRLGQEVRQDTVHLLGPLPAQECSLPAEGGHARHDDAVGLGDDEEEHEGITLVYAAGVVGDPPPEYAREEEIDEGEVERDAGDALPAVLLHGPGRQNPELRPEGRLELGLGFELLQGGVPPAEGRTPPARGATFGRFLLRPALSARLGPPRRRRREFPPVIRQRPSPVPLLIFGDDVHDPIGDARLGRQGRHSGTGLQAFPRPRGTAAVDGPPPAQEEQIVEHVEYLRAGLVYDGGDRVPRPGQILQCHHEILRRGAIQTGGGFVEQKHRRPRDQFDRHRYSLPLPPADAPRRR
mmetsp:Transcript_34255/g.102608  ORF Transcript_34255/g.102608 Transcript_34255/m.102608 type:complete len:510 (+) Transcript_34255:143-1672(+)